MSSYAIEISALQKKFGQQTVLNGVDLKVPEGKIVALLGPNGAGKTTLINILSTLVAPDGGSAKVAGYDVVRDKEKVKLSISLTGQFAAVDESLSSEENLRMMGRLSGLSRTAARARASELLEYFNLTEVARKRVKTFSGGMRRRLDLALSLVVRRPILFLDEPTTGLDTRSRRALWDIILDLSSDGVTVFLTTQYLEEADQLADTIAVISDGRIVAHGTPAEMKSRIGGEVVELRNTHDDVIREIPTGGSIADLKEILDGLVQSAGEGTRISIRRPSLDDVFLALTATEKEAAL
ncbi:ATP-binding cassette domain-containing protein [Paenibacillus motobuensis]|uniref:ATP-binding cassette domain-containing protein n=1 Tax=Paenibacillus TaxID=44249 RepID=UPI00203F6388|nr:MULTISPECIES: ATP-binding cassette domain-containing protein [Paenibacillus]MCM3038550.1 ATP-binding cassette domain-containing protein [Paenibacillus lutimineralis]MCM3645654.1 ATP-binding cassette domain-containing protein [Paenibacillus motobuensis]